MSSSVNVYDDLGGTDLGENILKLERTNQTLQRHIEKQESDISRLCAELTQMKRVQQNLARNISELFKTAKAEIARKDRMIADLRGELDRLIFRRQQAKRPPAEPPGEPPDLGQANKRHKCEPPEEAEPKKPRNSSSRCCTADDDGSILEHDPERRSSSSSHSSRYKREELRHSTSRTSRDERYGSRRRRSPRPRRHRSRKRSRGDNRKTKDADAPEPKPSNNKSDDNSVVPQDDVVDSTVPSLPSKTTSVADFGGGGGAPPETDAVRESVEVVVSTEPLVPLKESCNVTLSASITEGNGSDSVVVCKKPVRRRRCVIQILD